MCCWSETELLDRTLKSQESGCGSVGRAVAFNIRGPRFDSSHRKIYIEHLFVYYQLY